MQRHLSNISDHDVAKEVIKRCRFYEPSTGVLSTTTLGSSMMQKTVLILN